MKALFGGVSLLVALAIVGLVAVRQLKAIGQSGRPAATGAGLPPMSASGTVGQQARQLEKQVADDVVNAMNRGAAAREDASDKP